MYINKQSIQITILYLNHLRDQLVISMNIDDDPQIKKDIESVDRTIELFTNKVL